VPTGRCLLAYFDECFWRTDLRAYATAGGVDSERSDATGSVCCAGPSREIAFCARAKIEFTWLRHGRALSRGLLRNEEGIFLGCGQVLELVSNGLGNGDPGGADLRSNGHSHAAKFPGFGNT
jgi:hypothetical protein